MTEHMYIQCHSYFEWKAQYKRFNEALDEESFYCEVPNSLGGEPHPQFTVTILGYKITVWVDSDTKGTQP